MNTTPTIRTATIRRTTLVLTLFVTTAATGISPARAQDLAPDPKLLAKAKVSREQAQQIALGRVPAGSTVQSAELEREGGVLRWSLDLKVPNPPADHGNRRERPHRPGGRAPGGARA